MTILLSPRSRKADDTIRGGANADEIFGQGGNDSLSGDGGDDTVMGGTGEDTILAGPGDDLLFGGTESDLFLATDPGNHTIVGGEDADGLDIDVIDLSGVNARKILTDPEAGFIEYLDGAGNVTHTAEFSEIERVICFTPGTLIATPLGVRPVEGLSTGDRVITRDNGLQVIRWTGHRVLSRAELVANPALQPVLVRIGALGAGAPETDLLVSPNHRMLLTSEQAHLMFGEHEVLVAAKHLTGLDGVAHAVVRGVSYLHILFDRHEVVLANGAWSESFQPGEYALNGLARNTRDEILSLFPELEHLNEQRSFAAARLSLKAHEARLLVHEVNG